MTATFLANFNTILNVASLLGIGVAVLYFAPRAWKAAEARAREEALQRTIDAYKGEVEALRPEVEALRSQVADCRDIATKWEAKYSEQSKYTAPEALAATLAEMTQTRVVIETSMHSLGELMMEHSKLVATALDRLDSKSA